MAEYPQYSSLCVDRLVRLNGPNSWERRVAQTTAYSTENGKMARLILTVDDSPSIRLMMQLTLTGEGYEVMQATDGIEALEFARNHHADLVLTDINMPRMDGLALIRE